MKSSIIGKPDYKEILARQGRIRISAPAADWSLGPKLPMDQYG